MLRTKLFNTTQEKIGNITYFEEHEPSKSLALLKVIAEALATINAAICAEKENWSYATTENDFQTVVRALMVDQIKNLNKYIGSNHQWQRTTEYQFFRQSSSRNRIMQNNLKVLQSMMNVSRRALVGLVHYFHLMLTTTYNIPITKCFRSSLLLVVMPSWCLERANTQLGSKKWSFRGRVNLILCKVLSFGGCSEAVW